MDVEEKERRRARLRENERRYKANNRDRILARRRQLRTGKYEARLRTKPDTCDICGRGGKIVFDHCHKRGHARGWLCTPCNQALGLFGDNPETLLKAVAYLRRTTVSAEPQFPLPGI